jgi:hypothetical protein
MRDNAALSNVFVEQDYCQNYVEVRVRLACLAD